MNVLVIGGTGVISTSVVDRLNELSHDVTVFNRGQRQTRYKNKVEVIHGDKNNTKEFKNLMSDKNYDAVIDMISYNENDAKLTLDALDGRVKHFVFTSTVATYKRPYRGVPVKENFDLYDTDICPYGFNKANMEHYLQKKSNEGIAITIIRPSLTYGIGCKNIGVMRNNYGIVKRIQENKPIVVFGDGTNPWAWTFAPDIAKAYAGVLNKPVCFGQIYNVTSDDHHIWDDLYLEFGKIIGIEPKLIHISTEMLMNASKEVFSHVNEEKMHVGIYDTTKIRRDVKEFVCDYNLTKTIETIYNWYESDASARIIDEKLVVLEDSIVEKYNRCMDIMHSI